MINELQSASVSMKRAGIKASSPHPSLKVLPQTPAFFLLVEESGGIADLTTIDNDRKSRIRKWETANGESFPTFNVPRMFKPANENAKKFIASIRRGYQRTGSIHLQAIRELIALIPTDFEKNWDEKILKKITKCLQRKPGELKGIIGSPPPEFIAFEKLLEGSTKIAPELLFDTLLGLVEKKLLNHPNDALRWMDDLLFGDKNQNLSLVLELSDAGRFPYPANHPEVLQWINERLMVHAMDRPPSTITSRTDALGDSYVATDPKFPEINLPVLGKVKLRSMFGEIPCQFRYGQAEADSFPLNIPARLKLKDAVEWLADRVKRGFTWQNVSPATDYNQAILIAYPSELPEKPPQLAALFGGQEQDDLSGPLRFENLAGQVVEALNAIVREHPKVEIRVFVLAKADKARTKLVAKAEFSAKKLIKAAGRWRDGCQNLPPLQARIYSGGKFVAEIEPITPYPTDVVSILKKAWIRGGEDSVKVKGVRIADGIALLIATGEEEQRLAGRLVRLAVERSGPLLLRVGHAAHRGDGQIKLKPISIEHADQVISLIGLLLYKLQYKKGDYMHGAPFLIGRLLDLADTLHMEYCNHVREKNVPPQLIGNALIPAALDNPESGLARLFERLRVYQAWATTAQGEGVNLAKWALHQLRVTADKLSRQTIPKRCDDAAKAQMMLGYLAKIPGGKEETDNVSQE